MAGNVNITKFARRDAATPGPAARILHAGPLVAKCDGCRKLRQFRPVAGRWRARGRGTAIWQTACGMVGVKTSPNRWIPLATAALGILAAIVATPLLFPAPASAGGSVANVTPKATTPATGGAPKTNRATDDALAQLGVAILAIAAVGGLTLWVIRKVRNMPAVRRGRPKSLEVLDILNLGNKKSLAVARVYDRIFVVGLGEGRVSLIAELKEDEAGIRPAEDVDVEGANTPAGSRKDIFQQILKSVGGGVRKPAAPIDDERDEVLTPARRREPARATTRTLVNVTAGEDHGDLL